MPVITVDFAPDGVGNDIPADKMIHLGNEAPPIVAYVLDGGMSSGKPSVMLRIDLPDGRTVLAETSARLFCTVGRMIMARYADLFEGD